MYTRVKYLIILAWLAVMGLAYVQLYPVPALMAGLPVISSFSITGRFLNHIFILFLFIVAANGWGRPLWHNHHLLPLEKFLFATGTGLGILSLVILFADLAGVTGRILYFTLLLAGTALFLVQRLELHGKASFHLALWLALSSVPLISSFIGALAPPTQFDSLTYHLALPAAYLAQGKMYAVQHNFFFAFPQNMEMLFQMALSLDGPVLANLMHWMFLPLTALCIIAFSHRFWRSRIGLAASVIWLFTPAALFISTGTYVDLGLAFFVFLSFYAVAIALETNKPSWIYGAGFFLGIALGIKYTAAAAGAGLFLLILFWDLPGKPRWKAGLLFCAASALVFAPWLVKNLIFLKNPIAPWGTSLFAGSAIAPDTAAAYFAHIKGHGFTMETVKDVLSLPWKMTAYGYQFGGSFDVLGPLFILFIPALFLQDKIDKMQRIVFCFTAAFFAVWLCSGKVLRFLVPVMPFFSLLAAQGFSHLYDIPKARYIASFFLLAGLAHNTLFFHWTMASVDPYATVIGSERKEQYLTRKINYFHAFRETAGSLPADSKILFWGETRSYYWPPKMVVVPTVFDRHPLAEWSNSAADGRALAAALKKEGFTHILVNGYEAKRLGTENLLSPHGKTVWKSFQKRSARIVFQDAYCRLYELTL